MKIFHQLRWKLTFSYTLVTVGALLVVTLILGGYVFSRVLLPNNVLKPEGLVQILQKDINPLWDHILSQKPVDQGLINILLQNPNFNISTMDLLQVGSIKFSIRTISRVRIFLIAADGILLGASDPSFPPTTPLGQPFPVERVPGLEAPFQAALAGVTDAMLLYSTQDELNLMFGPSARITMALPIINRENTNQGQVLGVFVVIFDSFPYQSTIPSHLVDLAVKSLLIFLLGAGIMGTILGSFSTQGLTMRFKRLATATDLWSEGDFSAQIEDHSRDEITMLAGRLNNMAQQLQGLLRKKQEMAVSEERNRLARDLHDSAKQQALAASFELGTALTLCDRDPVEARKHLVEADTLVDAVRQELTNLVYELRPLSSDGQNFSESLKDYALEWAQRNGMELICNIEEKAMLPLEDCEALFRITQEALANITRHSGAHHVSISLVPEAGSMQLTIQDDGCGFDVNQQFSGLGLQSMKERTESFGGTFELESNPGQGTKISVSLPIS